MHRANNIRQQIKEINQLINEYNKADDEKIRCSIVKQLKYNISDPIAISNSEYLNENSPLKIKARIIADAFESITNGMLNPEATAKLDDISRKSVFYDWKLLIQIIENIYKCSFKEAEELIKKISEDSCVYSIKELLLYLISNTGEYPSGTSEFINKINSSENEVSRNINEITSCLETGNWESFIDISILLINNLLSGKKKAAIQLAMWCIKNIYNNEYHANTFISNLKFIFGESETFRIIALALIKENTELSLFFWVKTLISRIESVSIDFTESREYLIIINELFSEYQINSNIKKEYKDSLKEMLRILNNKIELSNIDNKNDLLNIIKVETESSKKEIANKKPKHSKAVQLELF